jgi:hypothetical protein
MLARTRSSLTYANVMATLALFLALGGGAYAAFKLPKNSVGSKQIKANAVNSSKVQDRSLLAGDFKAGQLPAGERGPQGVQGIQGLNGGKGDPCLPSDPNCKGPKGDPGQQGPGALSLDGQVPANGAAAPIHTINGMTLEILCQPASGIDVYVKKVDSNDGFYGWGTKNEDGTIAEVMPFPDKMQATGANRAQLAVVARSTGTGATVKWTRFDVLGIRGSACNYHALIIPPS